MGVKHPPHILMPGPTFPSVQKTSEWHRVVHEAGVPDVNPLESVLHPIAVDEGPCIPGAQHNPSVFVVDGELHALVRVLHGRRTTNFVGRVSEDWTLPTARRVNVVGVPPHETPAEIEDLRIFSWRGGLWAIAAAHDGHNPPYAIRQALLELSPDGAAIRGVHVQASARHEKNWMPAVLGDRLRLVYSVDPLVVLEMDGYRVRPEAKSIPQTTGHLRGGSPLVPWQSGGQWLAIVHEVHRPRRTSANHNHLLTSFWPPVAPDPVAGLEPVVYLHRFAIFDAELTTVRFSPPWYFKHVGIEFCPGLVAHGGRLIASFGVADKQAWLAEIALETVAAFFHEPQETP